ncbi:MAG: NupC/NupG family nucleoside CNT transporter [Bradymonadia bacterium]
MIAVLGLAVLVLIAVGLSTARREIVWRRVLIGFGLQAVLAVVLLRLPAVQEALLSLNSVVHVLDDVTTRATQFMFGYLADPSKGFIVAFKVLPLIMVISALSAVLFHWGVLPAIIRGLAWALGKVLPVPPAVAFSAASSVFFGIIEAPLLIRPWLGSMSNSGLFTVLVCGMSTVAGTVMVIYAQLVEGALPGALGHMIVASLISVPAALTFAHLMMPDTSTPDGPVVMPPRQTHNAMEALMEGTAEGTKVVVGVATTLIVLFACVYLVDHGLGLFGEVGGAPLTVQRVGGWCFKPVMWLVGVPWEEAGYAGELMGTKTLLNEYVAYDLLQKTGGGPLSAQSRLITTYALCGFANLGSLGILVGGLGSLLPDRRGQLTGLGARALVAGTLATLSTGAVVGLVFTAPG